MAGSEQAFRVLQQRVAAVEARLSEIDPAFGASLYRLERESIRTRIELGRLLDRDGIARASEEEIDAVIEEQEA
jgi:hypothetical protein